MSYGYDEAQHTDMAYVYSTHPFHFYGPGQLHATAASASIQRLYRGDVPTPRFAIGSVTPRQDRPDFAALGGHTIVAGSPPNQMVQHPPLYYWTEAIVLRVPGVSQLAWDVQVWLMRLLSVVFLLPIPVLAWASTRRLASARRGGDRPVGFGADPAILAAVVPLTVPNLLRDGSAVSNDSLLILTTSVLLYLICRVLTGDTSRRTGALIGVALAAALLTKGFALVLPPVVLAAYLLGSGRERLRTRAGWLPIVFAAVGATVGGLWWLRNLVDYGSVQVDGVGLGYEHVIYGPQDNTGTLAAFVPRFLKTLSERIWGGIGLPDHPTPGAVIIGGWLVVVLVGVLAAVVLPSGPRGRSRSLLLAAVPILTIFVVAAGSFATFRHWATELTGAQGRYIYHTIVAVAALASLGWARLTSGRLPRATVPVVMLAAALTNAVAWIAILRGWYAPSGDGFAGGIDSGWHALLRWSPVPDAVTILLVGVLPIASSVLALGYVAKTSATAARQGESPRPGDPPKGLVAG
jgi:4-amino-4-deoxy-L-arabinose transferase-like glycosyltransferase